LTAVGFSESRKLGRVGIAGALTGSMIHRLTLKKQLILI